MTVTIVVVAFGTGFLLGVRRRRSGMLSAFRTGVAAGYVQGREAHLVMERVREIQAVTLAAEARRN